MNINDLLRELRVLTHAQRMRRMAEVGRSARTSTAIATVIGQLERGELAVDGDVAPAVYGRILALQSCYGSGDGEHVVRALSDASIGLRRLALTLVPVVCNDTQIAAALSSVGPRERRRLCKHVLRGKRQAALDAFLETFNTAELIPLLSFGSEQVVQKLLPDAEASLGSNDWAALARRHPVLVANAFTERAHAASTYDARLQWQINAALPAISEQAPDSALALLAAATKHGALSQFPLKTLSIHRPNQLADLAHATGDVDAFAFDDVAWKLDTERLVQLAREGRLRQPAQWLRRLAPAVRGEVYAVAAQSWRDADGIMPLQLVELLPAEPRITEARRHLQLAALATRPAIRLHYAALLPADEARAALEPFLNNPDAELRAVGLEALIRSARYGSTALSEVLQLIRSRRNEQDPVRERMLAALAALPPTRWIAAQLDDLGQVIRDALDARDCSAATASQAAQLVTRLLPFHPEWGAQWLATIGRERGVLLGQGLGRMFTTNEVRLIAGALLPVLQAWEPREQEQAIFRAARLFNERLELFPELLQIVERLVGDTRTWVASQALSIIEQYAWQRFAALVPIILREDASWATQPLVYQYLHRHRQDLLTPLLGQTAFGGRFSTGRTRFVLPLLTGFYRWTPEQQGIFARVLEQVTRDEQRDTTALFHVIKQLAALPAITPRRLNELARIENPRLAVRDAALQALSWVDEGKGIPTLLDALGDERARIAIYALRRAVLNMSADRALALLRDVPVSKVTVAKEVIRLVGELPTDAAYSELLVFDQRPLHRDVRVALLRALWGQLERPATWPIFERAAVSDDPAIAAGVIRIPAERVSAEAQRRLAALMATLLVHPEPTIRLETLKRCAVLPISDPNRMLAAPLLQALASSLPDESRAAAHAVIATYIGREAGLVGRAVQAVLPERRALQTFVDALQEALPRYSARLLSTAEAVLGVLADDPLTTRQQIGIAVAALEADALLAWLRAFAARGGLDEAALMAGIAAFQVRRPQNNAFFSHVEQALANEADPRLRRLALSALIAESTMLGWNIERRAKLETYRADAATLIAAAAQFTFPPEE